ncbi:glutamate receptor ionotropic, kainate 3-like [Palaemon carinicauda]|uniref:glutamate receptor ionotropic, kainate 3-like n=1 Tax=Palaemon carinicauda TaxID=392227 RepID=UPI0035B5E62E
MRLLCTGLILLMLQWTEVFCSSEWLTEETEVRRATAGLVSGVQNEGEFHLGSLVRQIYRTHMDGCHTLLVKDGNYNGIFNSVLRSLRETFIPEAILDLEFVSLDPTSKLLLDLKRGEKEVICRVFLIDMTGSSNISQVIQFMDSIHLFLIPHTHLLFIGPREFVQETLMDEALWNTVQAFYLVLQGDDEDGHDSTIKPSLSKEKSGSLSRMASKDYEKIKTVTIYKRCFLCNNGELGIHPVQEWNPARELPKIHHLFDEPFRNMLGHRLNIVNLDWYPFVDFVRDSDEVATTVTPMDSLDVRMLRAISKALNFTFQIRVPWDEQWGTSTESGNWTGMIGTLQHHKADFAMSVSYLTGRMKVVDYSRIYVSEPIVMVMAKSRPRPPYMALIQPLQGAVWATVLLSTITAGVVYWALQLGWKKISGRKVRSLETLIFHTWSILFEEPPPVLPENISGQMFIGWWWVYCTLITVVYKSSLIAHLSVPGKSSAIDSFEQLLKMDGWTWGFENPHDAAWEWFKTNENPTIKRIYENMEIQGYEEQMKRLLTSNHVLITWKYRVMSIIASFYTNKFGYAPTYFGQTEYFNYGGYGWAFRKNAPFLPAIDLMKQRLIEAGLINQWVKEMLGKPKVEPCSTEGNCKTNAEKSFLSSVEVKDEKVVLSLHHLQSVFFVLLLGFNCALLAFIGEFAINLCH